MSSTGRPVKRPAHKDLEEAWTLGPDEHALLSGKKGPTRLGFAVVLRFFAKEGRFPDPEEIAEDTVGHVASQVDVGAAGYQAYDHHGRTAEYHRAQIREAFGFRAATIEDADELAAWLLEEVAPHGYDAERLKEAAYARPRALKVEPPTPGRVDRLVRSALRRYDERFCETTLGRLPESAVAGKDALLAEPDASGDGLGDGTSAREEPTLARLRADPGRAGVEGARTELASATHTT